MPPAALFEDALAEHIAVAERCRRTLGPAFAAMAETWARTVRGGGRILLFGNGGSAADAQHLAAELSVRFGADRPALPALALCADGVALTACANDLGYERVFARQIEALGRPGDLAVGLSTSGCSANVIEALKTARRLGLGAAGFTGGDGGAMAGLADPLILVPSTVTARIQEMHIAIGHALCAALEAELGLVPGGEAAAERPGTDEGCAAVRPRGLGRAKR
ncbi:MAG: D-sedoheptulose 7-phosphate isomerase [Rhodospirillaceae bacterium]|nr:D-sedoheptulose 7-phosphate isomerase [Rhodospirillaceae bacterium]